MFIKHFNDFIWVHVNLIPKPTYFHKWCKFHVKFQILFGKKSQVKWSSCYHTNPFNIQQKMRLMSIASVQVSKFAWMCYQNNFVSFSLSSTWFYLLLVTVFEQTIHLHSLKTAFWCDDISLDKWIQQHSTAQHRTFNKLQKLYRFVHQTQFQRTF